MHLGDEQQEIFEDYEVPDPVRVGKVIKFIRKYFKEVRGLNILDCGISKGGVADILSREGANCFGIDINPREIEGVKIVQADLNKGIPEFGIKFDVIFAGEIIEHLFDDSKFIRECHTILKPGGILIITVPNLTSFFNRFLMFFGSMPLTAYVAAPFHYHVYNRRRLKNLIKDEGFEIIKAISSYWPLNIFTKIPVVGRIFGFLGTVVPTFGNQLIVFARKK
jgi:2-polyprenyl-3-methyl-5-hydroxy-6-metoxy-1,4-benzoquinol methylase